MLLLSIIITRCEFFLVYFDFKSERGFNLILLNSNAVKQLWLNQLVGCRSKVRVELQHLPYQLYQLRIGVRKVVRDPLFFLGGLFYLLHVLKGVNWSQKAQIGWRVKVIHLFNDLENVVICWDVLPFTFIIWGHRRDWVAWVSSKKLPSLDIFLIYWVQ